MTLLEFLTLTWEWLVAEYEGGFLDDALQQMKKAIGLTKEGARQWWSWAKGLTIGLIVISLFHFVAGALIGGYMHTGWPNALAGLLIALPLFILLVWWTPLIAIIAVVNELAHLRVRSVPGAAVATAKWWLGLTCGILLWQVIASLAFTFIPYWNAPSRIPVMLLLALALALIGIKWGGGQKHRGIIKVLVIAAFITQVAVCFIPQLATLATASSSRLDNNVLATAKRVEREGFFPASPPATPPPRDIGWIRWQVPTTNSVVRVYNGDEFIYKSPSALKISEVGGTDHLHNSSSFIGEVRNFKFYNLPAEGREIKILPADGTNVFWLDFRIESRRTS